MTRFLRLLPLVCILAAACLGGACTAAHAQMVPGPHFCIPKTPCPSFLGRFYVQGGVRFRVIDTLRIRQEPSPIVYREEGIPPFGPNAAGYFGTGTGIPGYPTNPLIGDPNPNISGYWAYNNGFIDPQAPTDATAAAGNLPYPQPPEVMLGRFVTTSGSGSTTTTVAYNIGSFQINDTYLQVDNPVQQVRDPVMVTGESGDYYRPSDVITKISSVAETTRVNWSRLIDGTYRNKAGLPSPVEVPSRLFDGVGFGFTAGYDPQLWTPVLEVGYRASDAFDVIYSFSSYNFDVTASRSQVVQANFGRRGFTDTFSFYSNVPNTWRTKVFNSATSLQPCGEGTARCRGCGPSCADPTTNECNGDCQTSGAGGCPECPDEYVANYRIWPDGVGQGAYPLRQFYDVFPNGAPRENLQEEMSQRVDVSVKENRLGGRSWIPLLPNARMGVSLGAILSPISFRISGNRRVTSLGPQAPGLALENRAEVVRGVWWNMGLFASLDLQLGYRSWFAQLAVDYSVCRNQSANMFSVETTVNPGGFSAFLSAGVSFW
ncbi:MAG: hypothetical protein ACP5LD_11745 [Desulfomonilaceae bacterium]